MRRATSEEVETHGLQGGSKDDASSKWWIATVPVWSTAAVLDFVFANEARTAWDNCNNADFHTLVAGAASGEELVGLVFDALEPTSREESLKDADMAERRVLQKATLKARAARRRRELRRQILYTEPAVPQAGQRIKLFYNPDRTPLRGRPDVYVKGGFNRWSHPERIEPILMTPAVPDAGGLGYLVAEIDVPSDAYTLDVVFTDSAESHGGFYDNNSGLDYHIDMEGSSIPRPRLRIAHVSSEMAPIAKAGGLGDVVTALGRAVQEEEHDVQVVLPKYDCLDYSQVSSLA